MSLDHSATASGVKRYRPLLIRIFIGFAILYALVSLIDPEKLQTAFSNSDPLPIIGAFLLMALNIFLQLAKWHYLLKLAQASLACSETFRSFLFGITVGLITPGQIGEFGGRAYGQTSLSSATIIGLTLIDKLQITLIITLGGMVSVSFLYLQNSAVRIALISVSCLAVILVFFNLHFLRRLAVILPSRFRDHEWVQDGIQSIGLLNGKSLLYSFGLTSGYYLVLFLQFYLLLNAFESVSVWNSYLGFAAVMFFKGFLPISFGDLGVREGTSVYVFSLLGVHAAASFNASVLLFVFNLLIPACAGLVIFPWLERNRKIPPLK
ncbi:MAG: lysylphosphatidylglycerol synthase transmembrane domain-containing protein [bacterium]